MDPSIAFIIPNTLVYNHTKQVLSELGLSYPIYRAAEEEALQIGKTLAADKTQIVISAGITYEYLKRSLPIPVMEMPFSGIETAKAISEALKYSNRIVHLGTLQLFYHIKRSLDFLGVDSKAVRFYALSMDKTIEEQTMEMIGEGYEVFIGGYVVTSLARKYGKKGIEVDVDDRIIRSCISDAQSISAKTSESKQEARLKNAILQATSDGIIAIDNDRNIFLTNQAADMIIPGDLKGKNLEETMEINNIVNIDKITIEQINMKSEYTPVIMNESPIMIGDEQQGSVISIKTLKEFQDLKYKTRQDLFVQGLWAEHTFNSIKGSSNALLLSKEKAQVYAKYNSPVLISGETGTGKEVFAQSIHNASRRKMCPWVPVNCASLPENLIESELFGYVKGAFTGANKEGKMGFFELADGGTIFLDEISELPISIQSKLLRVIQEGDVIRVGSDKIIHVDVRIICSSNKDLLQLIQEKKFKEDLYYRLNVLEIKLSPLRERREDIEPLANTFLNKFSRIHEKNIKCFSPEVLELIKKLPLYGNVRELSNIIERMVIFTEGESIVSSTLFETVDLNDVQRSSASSKEDATDIQNVTAPGNLKNLQKEMILATLEKHGGNKAAAARALGIDPSTLWRRLKKYELNQ